MRVPTRGRDGVEGNDPETEERMKIVEGVVEDLDEDQDLGRSSSV